MLREAWSEDQSNCLDHQPAQGRSPRDRRCKPEADDESRPGFRRTGPNRRALVGSHFPDGERCWMSLVGNWSTGHCTLLPRFRGLCNQCATPRKYELGTIGGRLIDCPDNRMSSQLSSQAPRLCGPELAERCHRRRGPGRQAAAANIAAKCDSIAIGCWFAAQLSRERGRL